jgi:phosphotriesterase-related protein
MARPAQQRPHGGECVTPPDAAAVAAVPSAAGNVELEALGRVLMHEHVFVLDAEAVQDYSRHTGWDEERRVHEAVLKLTALREAGFDTLVDLTVLGMGRDVRRIRRVAEQSDINILVATGVYADRDLPWFLRNVGPRELVRRDDPMVAMFIDDIERGIGDTGIRAAIIKCVSDLPGITHGVERSLRATAQAHRATGAPITTHSHAASRGGIEQQALFAAEGVDLSRVIIGHSGDSTDLDYLRTLLDRGSYLGMDRFGMDRGPHVPSFQQRVDTVATLCELGYAQQLLLSHDAHCWMDWLPDEWAAGTPAELPDWNFLHIARDVIPALQARGVSADLVDVMMRDNPRRIFANRRPY